MPWRAANSWTPLFQSWRISCHVRNIETKVCAIKWNIHNFRLTSLQPALGLSFRYVILTQCSLINNDAGRASGEKKIAHKFFYLMQSALSKAAHKDWEQNHEIAAATLGDEWFVSMNRVKTFDGDHTGAKVKQTEDRRRHSNEACGSRIHCHKQHWRQNVPRKDRSTMVHLQNFCGAPPAQNVCRSRRTRAQGCLLSGPSKSGCWGLPATKRICRFCSWPLAKLLPAVPLTSKWTKHCQMPLLLSHGMNRFVCANTPWCRRSSQVTSGRVRFAC